MTVQSPKLERALLENSSAKDVSVLQRPAAMMEYDAVEIHLHPPREYSYTVGAVKITLRLFHDNLVQTADSLQNEINGDSLNRVIKLIVPDSLRQFKMDATILTGDAGKYIDIHFGESWSGRVFYDPGKNWSSKIK